jgi:hypothetical protein
LIVLEIEVAPEAISHDTLPAERRITIALTTGAECELAHRSPT